MTRAFLPAALACLIGGSLAAEGAHLFAVIQKGRAFSIEAITIAAGDTLHFTNEDGFLHELFVHSPTLTVDSDEQQPGQNIDIPFPVPGHFRVLCAIHPKMALEVNVR